MGLLEKLIILSGRNAAKFARVGMRLTLVILAAASVGGQAQSQYTAKVDPNLVLVSHFEGWGTSLCWWAHVVGGFSNRSEYASLAFSTLKLNIVRYNIGGGENPSIPNTMQYRARIPGFQPSPGVWDWSVDQNQRWMLKEAIARGADQVVAFANSPPWWMTVSGSVTGSTNGTSNNLDPSYETAFADYLATVVSNLTLTDGVQFDHVTPINEPTAGWWQLGGGQEGCHTDATQQARLIAALRSALATRGISAGVDAPEDFDQQSTINSLNTYGAGHTNMEIIATHTYSANNPLGLRQLAATLKKPVWISEYGDNDATGMQLARRIHDDITGTLASAWINWQFVDNATGWGCLRNPLDDSDDTSYVINRKFYVMGQFSQFIRPGFQIVSVNDNNSLAGYDPTNHVLVIVALNQTANSLAVTYDLSSFNSLSAMVSAVRTSSSENQAALAAIPVTNNTFNVSLPQNSVTTFTMSNAVPANPGEALRAWYSFEGNAQDVSRNGNNGTLSNGVSFVAGKLGAWAAQFNGSNSFVLIPRMIANDFTVAFWIKTTNSGNTGEWWSGRGLVDGEVQGPADDYGVTLVGGRVALGAGTPDKTVTTTNSVNDGLWHHITATRKASSGEQLVYVDGALQASGFGPVGMLTAPLNLRIGSIQAGYAANYFNGAIDDLQLFARVFGPSEVAALMNHAPSIVNGSNSYFVLAGRTLAITNTATDPDLPAQSLTWNLLSAPLGAMVGSSNGIVSWRPLMAQASSTNTVTIQVADNGTPGMTATQSVQIIVNPPQSPQLISSVQPPGTFGMQVFGDAGPDYIIQTCSNLANSSWIPVFTNSAASPPFEWIDPQSSVAPEKFYRVILGP